MSKRRKLYQLTGMRRAGRAQSVMREPFAIIAMPEEGDFFVLAQTEECAFTRDGAGWPKEVARLAAAWPPHRLTVWQATPEEAMAAMRFITSKPPPLTTWKPI